MTFLSTSRRSLVTLGAVVGLCLSGNVFATGERSCNDLPSHQDLQTALKSVVAPNQNNGGFELNMWAVVVNKAGYVCAVAFSGDAFDDQWLGSRQIAAAKANTANNFSLDGLALSTAALLPIADTGTSLYSLEQGNPLDTSAAYRGPVRRYGQRNDPLVGKRPGGTILFGGGLALFDASGKVGGLGLSGDTSCADHNVAWRLRDALQLDAAPAGTPTDKLDYGAYATTGCTGNEQAISIQIGAGS